MVSPLEIFCCYARKDQSLLNELKIHLTPLQRQGLITIWSDIDIDAGAVWEVEIKKHLNTAQIILLLISSDFMASEYCYSTEMQRALERHEQKEAHVIPILLRPTIWKGAPFDKLQVLPTNAKPVTDRRSWLTEDEALNDVVEGIRKVVDMFEKVEGDVPRIREELSQQHEEEHSPITEIAELRAYIYSQEAEDAIRNGNWELADAKTRQALHENPRLNLRRELGLSISNSICQSFIEEHRREVSSSLQDGLFFYRNPSISPMFTHYSLASIEKAIFWLKEAQKQGEDQDGTASAELAKMYGINKKCAAMQEALKKAIDADPEWKELFRRPNSLILLVNGCINEPNIQDTLERLRKDLSLSNPEETFTHYIKERYGKVGYSLYWVIGRPDYWIELKESIPNFPLDISVFPNKDGDVWQAGASYIVPGNRVYIPKQNEYLPVHDLYNQLEKRFFLICPSE